jgi:hypothetical protein
MLALAVAGFAVIDTHASPYENRRAAAVKECEAIEPSRYQSGLYFNPDGYRSFYVRSECFQKAAIKFRDPSLCAQVKRRRAVLSSSWGYSEKNCRELVAASVEKDRRELSEIRRGYLAGHMTLSDFRIELDNNGRDFDIIPIAAGASPHGYLLRFEIVSGDGAPTLLHADGYFIDDAALRIYVPRAELRRRVPDLSPERTYVVRATMTFSLPTGTGGGEWSEAFVEKVFPLRERSQTITKTIVFPGESAIRPHGSTQRPRP